MDETEKQHLMDVLEANRLSTYVLTNKPHPDAESRGDKLTAFQRRFNEYLGVKHGIPIINGTAALDVACRSLLMAPGDEVITPAHSFIASGTCALFCNTIPVFVDLNPETFCISPERIEEAITPRTRAIIAVHLDGYMCDMDRIMDIAKKHDLYVIEDCARAHASEWRGRKAGSIGHFGCFSFQSSKVMTCGEGGYLCTNDDHLYSKAWSIHNAGRQVAGGFYEHFVLGGNERMGQLEAAVLLPQLARLPEQARRREYVIFAVTLG
jgi:dTDP-4-amino-4,6-dideoxygalactose transaminase